MIPQTQDGMGRDDFNLQEAFVLARETLHGLLLVNGGGAVALLSFYGNLLSQRGLHVPSDSRYFLTLSLISFAAGLFLSVLATSFGYLTQLSWGAAVNHKKQIATNRRWAHGFHAAAFIWAALSSISFVAGVVSAAVGLHNVV